MESKIMMIWPMLLLFLVLSSISSKSNEISMTKNRNTALNRIIFLYNEYYIYYCKSMNKYLNSNKECKKCTTIFKYG